MKTNIGKLFVSLKTFDIKQKHLTFTWL